MQTITSIQLNGRAYALEGRAYEALRSYLERAERHLETNPDCTEIMSDLEQAIGEKCKACLHSNKDVVTAEDMDRIIRDMGPVDASVAGSFDEASKKERTSPASKRLYLIREGSLLAGVCTGLAAYFDIDVAIVRVVFVLLTIFTGGVWILIYAVLMLVVPYANTPEERAAARGAALTAQDIVNRAKETYARLREAHRGNTPQ